MAKFDLMQTLANQNKGNVVKEMLTDGEAKMIRIPWNQIIIERYKKYEIDPKEVEELAISISTIGLEQNLVVKETDDPAVYVVVTGHKRLSAIRYIFENNLELSSKIKNELEMLNCIVIDKDEPEIVTRFRMHETNQQQRKGFTVAEIEDYLETVEEAKKQGIKVNGKAIVGTTRAILQARFNISETMAKKYIKIIKEGNSELKKKLDDGDISINKAYEVLQGKKELDNNNSKKETKKESYEIEDLIKDIMKPYKSIQKAIDNANENYEIIQIENSDGEIIDKKVFDLLEECNKTIRELLELLNETSLNKE